jgi:hypothetical protein
MIGAYEQLRTEALRGEARPEGFGAVVYHGMIEGLKRLFAASAHDAALAAPSPAISAPITHDRQLLRLLANMVLQTQSELTHVY